MFAYEIFEFAFFLANTDWQYPISEDGEIKYFKTNKAHGKKFILKNGSDPVCIQQMPGRRSNSGITHCGNKYQKKNLFPHFEDFFGAGFECRVRLFCSPSHLLYAAAHSTNEFLPFHVRSRR